MCAFAVMSNKQNAFAYLQMVDAARWLSDWASFIGYFFSLFAKSLPPAYSDWTLFFSFGTAASVGYPRLLGVFRCVNNIQKM
jgi:hypothetical protein